MAAYPSTLPAPIVDGYGVQPVSATARTPMDSGPARVRRRFTRVPQIVTATWDYTDDEMATFKTWWENPLDLDMGANWFWITIPVGSGGTVTVEARFIAPYAAHPKRGGEAAWQVKGRLEVRNA